MFTLKIETDNAAFGEVSKEDEYTQVGQDRAAEVCRILQTVIDRVFVGDDCGSLRDINGNKVGSLSF